MKHTLKSLKYWWRNYRQARILRRYVRDKQRELLILESVSFDS